MPKKISVEQLMDDVLYISNQIKGLNMLLDQKKKLCKEYFKKTGHKSLSNDQLTIYTQERTKIDYDIEAIEETLPKEIYRQFIDKNIEVLNPKGLIALLKQYGVPAHQYRKCLVVTKSVNEDKLRHLYDSGAITVEDLEGCYDASTKLSVALKVKCTDAELKL